MQGITAMTRFGNFLLDKIGALIALLLFVIPATITAQNWLNTSPAAADYVTVGDLDVTGTQITVEALVSGPSSVGNIVSKHTGPPNSNYLLRMGSFEFTTSNGFVNLISGFTYTPNQVYHIAAVYDGSEARYYVNGCLVNSIAASGTLVQNNLLTAIGAQSNSGSELFNGYIDEVRIWNTARTQAQLEGNMNTPLLTPGTQPGLVGYYQFEGNYVNAQGNAAFNGTPVNGPTTGANPNAGIPLVDPILVTANFTDVLCNGGSDGTITASGMGGIGQYEYSTDGTNYQASPNFSGLVPAGYTVYASWNNSCVASTNVTIGEPTAINIGTLSSTEPSCNGGSDGEIIISTSGGTPGYSYNWTGGDSDSIANGLAAGTHTVTVTDANACTATESFSLNQPPVFSGSITSSADVTCNGADDGTATAEGFGGTSPYTYLWSDGQTDAAASGMAAGTHTVTITDAGGCTVTQNVTLNEPPVLTASISFNNDVSCNADNDGSATASGAGGVSPYTFQWSNGESNAIAVMLPAGNPTVTVTDYNGCTATQTITINEPTLLTASISSASDATCHGADNGTATAQGNGGTTNYTYSWSSGDNVATAIDLAPGVYTCTVTDANGCVATVDTVLSEPDTLIGSISGGTNVSCNGGSDGSITATAAGGTPGTGYSYVWSNNAQTAQITNLPAGAYTVTVSDANGCTSIVNTAVNEPAVLMVNLTNVNNISCFSEVDGSATASTTGGVFPYTYAWSNGGTNMTETALAIGTNAVTVTDANGCTTTASTTITEPSQITVTILDDTLIRCLGSSGTFDANAMGGTVPYTYHWNNGFVGPSLTVSPNVTSNYWVYAQDANGCRSARDSALLYILPILSVNTTPDASICEGDSLQINAVASGSNSNYTYAWSTGQSTPGPFIVYPDSTTTYTITVTDNCGSPDVIKDIIVTVNPLPEVDFVADTIEGCNPTTINFTNNTTIRSGAIQTWHWDFGNGETTSFIAPALIYDSAATYTISLIATSKKGCVDSLVIDDYITVHPVPVAQFDADPNIGSFIYPVVDFDDQSTGTTIWYWEFGDSTNSTLSDPSHEYPDTGIYFVTMRVENNFGCWDEETDRIVIQPEFAVYIPDAFTPDDDDINDVFKPEGVGFTTYRMQVFDRWSNLIYNDHGEDIGWDGNRLGGEEAEQGVFIYYIYFRDIFGKQRRYWGTVTLIR